MQSYTIELFKNLSDIVIIKKDDKVVDANRSFFNFFTNFKSINDIKNKRLPICRFFKKEKGYIFHNDDMKWIEFVLKYPKHSHKAKIVKGKNAFIFKLEVIKIEDNEFIIILKNITEIQAYKENIKKISLECENDRNLLKEYQKAINSGVAVSKNDLEGRITFVNRNFLELTGYKEEEVIGKLHTIIKHDDVPLSIYQDLWDTVQSKGIWKGILKNRTKDGKIFYTETTVIPILDKNQNILEYLSIRQNITNLIKAQNIVKRVINSKYQFLEDMGYEINVILENILLYGEQLLNSSSLTLEDRQQIEFIIKNNKKIFNLIKDIVTYAKINRGKVEFKEEEIDITALLNEIISEKEELSKQKDITIKREFANDIPPLIKIDREKLKDVLINIIDNAIKFSKANSEIEVVAKVTYEFVGGCRLYFGVKDYGIGIEEKNIEKIFEPFIQIEAPIIENYKGTGLGLALSQAILKEMNSQLEVESEYQKGSNFFFEINVEIAGGDSERVIEEEVVTEFPEDSNYKPKILVVDDNQVNRRLMEILIKKRGLYLELATDGKEAFEKATNQKFDMILMDINMPVMGGIEAMQKIKAYEKENNREPTTIISLSANVSKSDTDKYLNAGFDDCLTKPLRETALDEKLNKYIKAPESSKKVIKKEKQIVVNENPFEIRARELELDLDFYKDLLKMFFDEIEEEREKFEFAIQTIDFLSIKYHAHKIKGSSLNLKLDQISFIAADIEICARERKLVDYQYKFDKLQKIINKIKSEFNKI